MPKQIAADSDAKWRSDDVITNEEKDFSFFHLDERILCGLSKAGYRIPSQIQLEAIPLCITGSDVFIQEKSGTGKMLVFSIIALTAVLDAKDLQVLILSPTREGAFQIYTTINAIGSEIHNLKCECFIGGFSFIDDVPKAAECNIAVGTPGRIGHLIHAEKLKIDTVRLFVIDDVDEICDKYMRVEINDFINNLPMEKQTIITSPTCADDVLQFVSGYFKPSFLTCNCKNEPLLLGMEHYYHLMSTEFGPSLIYREKLEVLKKILSQVKFSQCIIFCRSIENVELLLEDIRDCGLSIVSMTKAVDQVERLQAFELLKRNKCRVFITTDVGSRSLYSENVDLIVNFDVPLNSYTYSHHCGRAGKNGVKSSIITLLEKSQKALFIQLKKEEEFESYKLSRLISKDLISKLNPMNVASHQYKQLNSGCVSTRNMVKKCNRQKNSKAGVQFSSLLTDKKGEENLFMVSRTVPKTAHKLKSASKTSKNVLHEAFDEMHLKREENCSKSIKKLPQESSKKKPYTGIIEDRCKMESSSQANSDPFAKKTQSCPEYLKCGKHSCINVCSRSSPIHLDKKIVCVKCKMQSNCGHHLDGCDKHSRPPVLHNFVHGLHSYCNSKPCYPSYQHCSFNNCCCHYP